MNKRAVENYRCRFHEVLEFIDDNPDEDLTLDRLSSLALLSKYHFHRRFTELFGISPARYVQLNRLKRAAYCLAFRDMQIIDIAMAAGYDAPDGFSRAFKKIIGQSPANFRSEPEWSVWYAQCERLTEFRRRYRDTGRYAVRVTHTVDRPVALLEHRGDARFIGRSLRNFIEWRRQAGLRPRFSETFNILYGAPLAVSANDYRIGLCASMSGEIASNPYGVTKSTILGGRCAVLRLVGSDDGLRGAIEYLYSQWLPRSGESLRDFPLFLQRVRFFPDVPEPEAVTDLFLPLA